MRADPSPLGAKSPASDAPSVPFASQSVTLTRQAHIELVQRAHYFEAQHGRAVARAAWREERYQKVLRQLKAQAAQREATLQTQLEHAQARIKDLQQRLFGTKTRVGRDSDGIRLFSS